MRTLADLPPIGSKYYYVDMPDPSPYEVVSYDLTRQKVLVRSLGSSTVREWNLPARLYGWYFGELPLTPLLEALL